MNPKFDELVIDDWKQFKKISIKFHPRLTILTGANGAGKTTISSRLENNQLSAIFKGPQIFTST